MFNYIKHILLKIRLKKRGLNTDDLLHLVATTKWLEEHPRQEVSWKL